MKYNEIGEINGMERVTMQTCILNNGIYRLQINVMSANM